MAFDIFAMAAGTTYPEGTVKINLDDKTAYEARLLDEKLNKDLGLSATEIKKIEKELREKVDTLQKGLITLHLRGLTTAKRDKIEAELVKTFGTKESDTRTRKQNALMLAAHYQWSENAKGEKDEAKWDSDRAEQFLLMIPVEAQVAIIRAMVDLSYRSDNYELVETSADFS